MDQQPNQPPITDEPKYVIRLAPSPALVVPQLEEIASHLDGLARTMERIADALERQSSGSIAAVQPEALSKADAARFLGVDEGTIEQLIRTRKLAYVQHGSQRGRVITVEALRAFLKAYREATGKELAAGGRKKG